MRPERWLRMKSGGLVKWSYQLRVGSHRLAQPPQRVERPLERANPLPARVENEILGLILRGELVRGSKLPPEREIAAQQGVSRNVVREAIHRLAAMNIVDVRHGAGTFVAALDMDSLVEPLEFAVRLEPATVETLLEARLVLEPPIARLAATRAQPDDLQELDERVAESAGSTHDPARFLEIDIEIHRVIVRMAGNPFLTRVMDSLGRLARAGREFTNIDPRMRATALRDHERIAAALRAGDAEASAQVMQKHLEHVRRILFERTRQQRAG
jgi:GntR family transcriptional regulator, transcriptional repressor for pyruvate dehydrogenase complex